MMNRHHYYRLTLFEGVISTGIAGTDSVGECGSRWTDLSTSPCSIQYATFVIHIHTIHTLYLAHPCRILTVPFGNSCKGPAWIKFVALALIRMFYGTYRATWPAVRPAQPVCDWVTRGTRCGILPLKACRHMRKRLLAHIVLLCLILSPTYRTWTQTCPP